MGALDAGTGSPGDGASDATAETCVDLGDSAATTIASAGEAAEYVLAFTGHSAAATSWGEAGNEAGILEGTGAHGLIGHVTLHQGATPFGYAMHLGALAAGEPITVRVSTLSAAAAPRAATLCSAMLTPPTSEGVANAP